MIAVAATAMRTVADDSAADVAIVLTAMIATIAVPVIAARAPAHGNREPMLTEDRQDRPAALSNPRPLLARKNCKQQQGFRDDATLFRIVE